MAVLREDDACKQQNLSGVGLVLISKMKEENLWLWSVACFWQRCI